MHVLWPDSELVAHVQLHVSETRRSVPEHQQSDRKKNHVYGIESHLGCPRARYKEYKRTSGALKFVAIAHLIPSQ